MPSLIAGGIPPAPDMDAVAERYRGFEHALSAGASAWLPTFRAWDELRRELDTWSALTYLRFTQDTRDARARAAVDRRNELRPVLTGFDVAIKRRYVASDQRSRLEAALGGHAFRLWETDLRTFDPAVESALVAEAKLAAEYTALLAGVEVAFEGETLNLEALARFASDPDRERRHRAAAARWTALGERGPELDRIFDALVRVRDGIARTLGFPGFTELGYARMQRLDYDRAAVERYRDAVATEIVPLANAIAHRAARRHGVRQLALWDERLLAAAPAPRPLGEGSWLLERAIECFAELDPRLGTFARMMAERGLTDLVTRAGKAGGGYCTQLPSYGVPFVFGNFNGTKSDVTTLMHELGHAFQAYSSRDKAVVDYLMPTLETAEVHSMSLEYLTWPHMERFFGDGAAAYREGHLCEALLFLPYGVAIDHFQHLVYDRPAATPAERHAMWRQVEQRYLPWRTYGDLERPAAGAFWQSQLHVFRAPFYYIDYTLALCCALQLWVASDEDPAGTLERYVRLCERGGEAAFGALIAGAGLTSPFDRGALAGVAARAREQLGV